MQAIVTADEGFAIGRIAETYKKFFGEKADFLEKQRFDSLASMLSQIPISQKQDLVHYGNARSSRSRYLSEGLLFGETSGSTSFPLQTPRGREDVECALRNYVSVYKKHVQPGTDRVAMIHHTMLGSFGEFSIRAFQEMGIGYIRVFPIEGICSFQTMYEMFEKYEITTMVVTPTLAYRLLFEFKKQANGILPNALKRIALTGELISRENAANIARVAGKACEIVSLVYGMSEIGAMMYGLPDLTYKGFEDFVFEIRPLDQDNPRSFSISPSGRSGRLVVTSLISGLLPIFRYDTGDVFTVWRDEANEAVFQFEGRDIPFPIRLAERQAIERELYQLEPPILHFDYKVDTSANTVHLTIVAESQHSLDSFQHIGSKLTEILERRFKFVVDLADETHPFFSRVVRAKSSKFAVV